MLLQNRSSQSCLKKKKKKNYRENDIADPIITVRNTRLSILKWFVLNI